MKVFYAHNYLTQIDRHYRRDPHRASIGTPKKLPRECDETRSAAGHAGYGNENGPHRMARPVPS